MDCAFSQSNVTQRRIFCLTRTLIINAVGTPFGFKAFNHDVARVANGDTGSFFPSHDHRLSLRRANICGRLFRARCIRIEFNRSVSPAVYDDHGSGHCLCGTGDRSIWCFLRSAACVVASVCRNMYLRYSAACVIASVCCCRYFRLSVAGNITCVCCDMYFCRLHLLRLTGREPGNENDYQDTKYIFGRIFSCQKLFHAHLHLFSNCMDREDFPSLSDKTKQFSDIFLSLLRSVYCTSSVHSPDGQCAFYWTVSGLWSHASPFPGSH